MINIDDNIIFILFVDELILSVKAQAKCMASGDGLAVGVSIQK